MTARPPFRVAICGIGGFASSHHYNFVELEKRGLVKVIATCDPALEPLAEVCQMHEFEKRGVAVFSSFDEMIELHRNEIDFAVVATPIHCHAGMHEALVRNGIACYLEKPPTLDPRELHDMLEVEKLARRPTHVSFSYIHLADRLELKRRLLAGEFGPPIELSFMGLAPRDHSYFERNHWAGKLLLGGTMVLDSCLGNAMAHFLNNMLFWAGSESVSTRARPFEIESELYRANPIEGCDTIFANCLLENGVTLRLAASHACDNPSLQTTERLVFQNATITIRNATDISITWSDGREEAFEIQRPSLALDIEAYLRFLDGHEALPPQSLEESLGFVETNALFYIAAKTIHPVNRPHLRQLQHDSPLAIEGIEEACLLMVKKGLPPSRSNMAWGLPGGIATIDLVDSLATVIGSIVAQSKSAQ
jgi:predicted dehydrogenase